jgi:hypothetical protein
MVPNRPSGGAGCGGVAVGAESIVLWAVTILRIIIIPFCVTFTWYAIGHLVSYKPL